MGFRFLDIELALQWAFCDELPKRNSGGRRHRPPTDYPAASPMFRGAVAERVVQADADGHSRVPGFPPACGETHPDAIIIEAATAALRRFAGNVFGAAPGTAAADPAGLAFGLEGPCGMIAGLPVDAPVDIDAAAAEAIANMAAIVACHARAGTRPKWAWRWVVERVSAANGQPAVVVEQAFVEIRNHLGEVSFVAAGGPDDPGDGIPAYRATVAAPAIRAGVYRDGAHCRIRYRPGAASVVRERAEYAAWRAGLAELFATLAGRLTAVRVLRPSAPWRPWCWDGGAETAPVLCAPAAPVTTREMAAGPRRAMVRRAAAREAIDAGT
jgi:hypothetical protein